MSADAHSRSLRTRFSSAASSYDKYAELQREAAGKLIALLEGLQPDAILEAGCGTGLMTAALCRRWPDARILAVDIAPGMAAEAARRLAGSPNVSVRTSDITTLDAGRAFPLVASNCALHWLHPFAPGMAHVLKLVARGGVLAATVMLRGTLAEVRSARLAAAPGKVPPASMPGDDEVLDVIERSGLELVHRGEDAVRASAASPEDLLRMLRAQGLTGGALSRAHAPLTRGELARLASHYRQAYGLPDGSVQATYRIGYYVARNPP